jgi:hypothetical protein
MLDDVHGDIVLHALDLQWFGDEGQRRAVGGRFLQPDQGEVQRSVHGFELCSPDPATLELVVIVIEVCGEGLHLEFQVRIRGLRLALLAGVHHVKVRHQQIWTYEPASAQMDDGFAILELWLPVVMLWYLQPGDCRANPLRPSDEAEWQRVIAVNSLFQVVWQRSEGGPVRSVPAYRGAGQAVLISPRTCCRIETCGGT